MTAFKHYKKFDKVIIRPDLVFARRYMMYNYPSSGDYVSPAMKQMGGKVMTISCFNEDNLVYFLVEDNHKWYWTDEMFVYPKQGAKI